MISINKLFFIFLIVIVTSCSSSNNTAQVSTIPLIIEHKYYSISDTVEGLSFDYTINSVNTEKTISAREGQKWIVMDVTFKDTSGNEDSYEKYASMYGEFVLMDDEKYIYKSYNKEQRTEFYGTTRDYILFLVPASKSEFIMFEDDYFFDNPSDLDDESRNIGIINL